MIKSLGIYSNMYSMKDHSIHGFMWCVSDCGKQETQMEVLRREEKYLLKVNEANAYEHTFDKILMTDFHSKDGNYMVRSLYFDTIDDKDFFDKIDEQNIRRKIRLRIYDADAQTAKLELKQKENVFQKKRSLTISKQDALALIDGNLSVLLSYGNPFADEVYAIMSTECYRPKTIVEYRRRAFMAKENNIRLTFDSQIKATEGCFDLFSKELLCHAVMSEDNVVFEVKYDKFMLGYISDLIGCIDKRTISSSKYCLGRNIGYPLYL